MFEGLRVQGLVFESLGSQGSWLQELYGDKQVSLTPYTLNPEP